MFKLRAETPPQWASYVADHLDEFLVDHAACERKASANAMHFVVRYPDRVNLVTKMVEVAREELEHFDQVWAIMRERGVPLAADERDPYVNELLALVRHGRDERFLDRLLLGSIIEYRGCERFAMLARELARREHELAEFYRELAASEARHRGDFWEVAHEYFDADVIAARLDELLDHEASVVAELPIRAAVH